MADINITLTIPDAKVNNARAGFLRMYPNISNPPVSDTEWVGQVIKRWLNDVLNKGYTLAHREATYTPPAHDPDFVV